MPTTRSNAKASSSKAHITGETVVDASDNEGTDQELPDFQTHIDALQAGLEWYRKRVHVLERKTTKLQEELDALHEAEDVSIQPRKGKSGGATVSSLQADVRKLKSDNRRLQKGREADKRKLRKYKMKEVKADAEELGDELLHGVPDTSHKMLKMLRSFQDTMTQPSLDEKQECAICFEEMVVGKCMSLPCEHIFCSSCLSKYQESAPVFKCPECRHSCKDEDSEVVNMTATAQWDHLLGLANDFARMDTTRGAQDTSDEEAEEHAAEDFIDDEEEEAADASSTLSPAPEQQDTSDPEPDVTRVGPEQSADVEPSVVPDVELGLEGSRQAAAMTPPPSSSYSQYSPARKRQRLEELAAERAMKKRR